MTDIQRWGHPDPDGSMHLYPLGPYVLYADHLAAVQQAEQRGASAYEAEIAEWGQRHYEQGQRDERERIKSVLRAYMHTSIAEQAAQIIDGSAAEPIRDAVSLVEALPVYLVDVRRDAFDQPQYKQTVGLAEVIAAIKGPQS